MFIEGLRCSGCTWLIERVLGGLQGVTAVQVNASACRARIAWDSSRTGLPGIIDRLAHAGYRGVPIDAAAIDDARRRESRDAMKRLGVAGLGAMQAMMFASALYFGAGQDDAATRDLFRWLALLVATPVVLYSARPFFRGAWRSLRARHLGIDIPVAVAVALIYAASIIQAMRGGSEVYFDSVSMFVFFLLVGRYLEMRARHRSGDLVDALARLTPPLAQRLRDDGAIEYVGTVELRPGDHLHVAEGELIPADGVLQSAQCRVDENLLSGESIPRLRRQGDMLLAGSVLIDGPARLRVERTGDTTVLGGIMRLVERAQAERPQLARAGERAAARFVLRVVLLAIATTGGWLIIDPSRAFEATVAVLVVSCPCAFALAVPAAITRALAVMAQGQVLVVRPDAVEKLAQATHAVFDKTGTLTDPFLPEDGVRALGDLTPIEALAFAGALARQSRHPVARAIAAAARATEPAEHVEVVPGMGVKGNVRGRPLLLGRSSFAASRSSFALDSEDGLFLSGDDGCLLAHFRVRERVRSGARAAIDALRADGLHVEILSGDAADKVEAAANQVGVVTWRADRTPEGKLERLHALRAGGAQVIVVGDGINDAPVLAAADVAVALASGAELAKVNSDIVLPGESLQRLPWARSVAQRALAVLRQNQRWSLYYNLVLVPPAALGFVPPWLAALGMSCSSLFVVLNALRIKGDELRTASSPAAALPATSTP